MSISFTESKSMCSLISFGKNLLIKVLVSNSFEEIEGKIKQIKHKFFQAKTRNNKMNLQKRDKELRKRLSEMLNKVIPFEDSEKIANFDIFDQNSSADWFDPEWMFGLRDGFDIVIGNPPYGIKVSQVDLSKYKFSDSKNNSASLFIEFGFKITKNNGVVIYIVPKSLAYSDGWSKTRKFLILENKLNSIIDVSKAFEHVKLEQVIICFSKFQQKQYSISTGEGWFDCIKKIGEIGNFFALNLDILPIYINNTKKNILEKIKDKTLLLGQISETCREMPFQKKISKNGIPILRRRNIGKYYIHGNLDFVTISKDELNMPKLKKLLEKTPKILSQNIVAHIMNPVDKVLIMSTIDFDGSLTLEYGNEYIYKK
ncbi:Eco57I restriction-modification methylase domain-containing protein [Thermodesulfobium acidiphilum]|uniref:Eco57I restriction-modification methylase domain-containing protein n=1 Tax=Thermodesulfobium acidiphilum TaxID=1794699 RepID=UPI001237855C|nr:N-6 DNA methylase [Thermodesulfobium acidiphilum]